MTLLERASTVEWQIVPLVAPIATVGRIGKKPVAVVDFHPAKGYRATLTDGTDAGTYPSLELAQEAAEKRFHTR